MLVLPGGAGFALAAALASGFFNSPSPGAAGAERQLPRLHAQQPAIGALLLAGGYSEIPLRRGSATGYWYAEMAVDGRTALLVIDTGAEVSVVTPDAARLRGYDMPEKGVMRKFADTGYTFTHHGHIYPRIGPVGSGGRPSRATVDAISGIAVLARDDGVPRCDGLLGNSFLQSHAAVLDYAAGKLYLLDPVRKESDLFGEWVCVARDNGTDVRRDAGLAAVRLTVRPDGITYGSEQMHHYHLLLDPSTEKKRMGWARSGEGVLQFIYKLDGDRLTLAGPLLEPAVAYPTDFKAKKDGTCVVVEFVRKRLSLAPPPREVRTRPVPPIPRAD